MSKKVTVPFMICCIALIFFSCAGSKSDRSWVKNNSIQGFVISLDSTVVKKAVVSTEPNSDFALTDNKGLFAITENLQPGQEYTFIAKSREDGRTGQTKVYLKEGTSYEDSFIYIVIGKKQNMEPLTSGELRRGSGSFGEKTPVQ